MTALTPVDTQLVETDTGEMVGQMQALTLVMGKFRFAPTGMEVHGEPTYDDWAACGVSLAQLRKRLHWAIGDWLRYGERRWGGKYAQALDLFGFDYSTLATDKWVAESIDFSRRRENLSFAHHRAVASLPVPQQEKWLNRAEKGGWNRETLRQEIRAERNPNPTNRAKSIVEIRVSYDALFEAFPPRPLVEVEHFGGTLSAYRPGWKSVDRLVRAVCNRLGKEWECRPLLLWGAIGWIARRRK